MDKFFKDFLNNICKNCSNKTPEGVRAMLDSAKAEEGISEDVQVILKSLGKMPRDNRELFLVCFSYDGESAIEVNGIKLESTILFTK
jgi:hypothetical protein